MADSSGDGSSGSGSSGSGSSGSGDSGSSSGSSGESSSSGERGASASSSDAGNGVGSSSGAGMSASSTGVGGVSGEGTSGAGEGTSASETGATTSTSSVATNDYTGAALAGGQETINGLNAQFGVREGETIGQAIARTRATEFAETEKALCEKVNADVSAGMTLAAAYGAMLQQAGLDLSTLLSCAPPQHVSQADLGQMNASSPSTQNQQASQGR